VSRRIARPYAAAFLRVLGSESTEALRAAEAELEAVATVLAKTPGLLRVFEVPSVSPSDKLSLIGTITKALEVRAEVARLLVVMTEHLRLRLLPEVVDTFRGLVDRKVGLLRGRLQVAVAPQAEQVQALAAALSSQLGTRVTLETELKPDLLAGFIVRVGSLVFDGSLDAQLRRFAAQAATQ
jgi:F-type H+-transporting ATPase subunit delta